MSQELCGECGKPFSDLCRSRVPCSVHKADCFQCLDCKAKPPPLELNPCHICKRFCHPSESYFEFNCGNYLCRYQFLRMDLKTAEVALPCGHRQMLEQVVAFMSAFCFHCGRVLPRYELNQLNICYLCEKEDGTAPVIVQQLEPRKQVDAETDLDLVCVIELLTKDLQQMKERLAVSQFTRKQIKQMVFSEGRDEDCLVCLQGFNLVERRPMMICLQQHLLCESCLRQPTLVDCPLCREAINKAKVVVSRERVHGLGLEKLMLEKYGKRVEVLREVSTTELGMLEGPALVDCQTQTDPEPSGRQQCPRAVQWPIMMGMVPKRNLLERCETQVIKPGRKRRKP